MTICRAIKHVSCRRSASRSTHACSSQTPRDFGFGRIGTRTRRTRRPVAQEAQVRPPGIPSTEILGSIIIYPAHTEGAARVRAEGRAIQLRPETPEPLRPCIATDNPRRSLRRGTVSSLFAATETFCQTRRSRPAGYSRGMHKSCFPYPSLINR